LKSAESTASDEREELRCEEAIVNSVAAAEACSRAVRAQHVTVDVGEIYRFGETLKTRRVSAKRFVGIHEYTGC
jgi:hypothetical protein